MDFIPLFWWEDIYLHLAFSFFSEHSKCSMNGFLNLNGKLYFFFFKVYSFHWFLLLLQNCFPLQVANTASKVHIVLRPNLPGFINNITHKALFFVPLYCLPFSYYTYCCEEESLHSLIQWVSAMWSNIFKFALWAYLCNFPTSNIVIYLLLKLEHSLKRSNALVGGKKKTEIIVLIFSY